MCIVRTGNIDQLDIFALDELSLIGLNRLVSPVFGEGLHTVRIAGAHRFQYWIECQVEEAGCRPEGVRMSAAHETVADQTDIELLFRHVSSIRARFGLPASC